MHDGQFFVLGLVAIGTFGSVARSWVSGRRGFADYDAPERQQRRMGRWQERHMRRMARWNPWFGQVGIWGQPAEDGLDAERQVKLLSEENAKLTGQVSRLEERLRVLERIATDPAERTAREIDALRDR